MKTWRRTVLLAVCAALLFSGMPRAAGKAESPAGAGGGDLYGPGEPLWGDPGGLHAGDGGSQPGLGGGVCLQPFDRGRRDGIR